LLKGIDVSKHQGKIDWAKVKADGIQFAIIRCGWGNDITSQDDVQFENNVNGCEVNGIPWGVYLYSYATNLTEAESEVQHVLRLLKGKLPLYPVYIDMEDADGYKKKRNVSNKTCADICAYFCERLTKLGYLAGVYANKDWLENRINDPRLAQYPIWLAQWNDVVTYKGKYGMWQYTSDGKVNGISGRVDMNYCYEDYPTIIKSKELNGYKKPVSTEPSIPKKSNDEIATEVIAGKWGNGEERKKRLTEAGYDYNTIQQIVNQKLTGKSATVTAPTTTITTELPKIKAGDTVQYSGRVYLTSYGGVPGKTVSGKFKVDRVIDGRKYGIHIPSGWIETAKAKKV